jgi:hypothetical protein
VFFAGAVYLIAGTWSACADAQRLALIITNKTYPASIGALENTHRDGERIAVALAPLGFQVVHGRDLGKAEMLAAVGDYVGRLERAGPDAVGFFYYAGHGAANSKYGDNYLIPVAAPISSDAQLPLFAVKLGEVIDAIGATPAKTNFVVFDACRDVGIGFASRSRERGLRREPQRRGMLVAFATDPGKTATDEGIYAEALAEEMQKPGVEAVQVFRAVRRRVLAATGEKQFPWTAEGLVDDFYFKPGPASRPPAPRPDESTARPGRPAESGDPIVGNWRGSYNCSDTWGNQGTISLRIVSDAGGRLSGIESYSRGIFLSGSVQYNIEAQPGDRYLFTSRSGSFPYQVKLHHDRTSGRLEGDYAGHQNCQRMSLRRD